MRFDCTGRNEFHGRASRNLSQLSRNWLKIALRRQLAPKSKQNSFLDDFLCPKTFQIYQKSDQQCSRKKTYFQSCRDVKKTWTKVTRRVRRNLRSKSALGSACSREGGSWLGLAWLGQRGVPPPRWRRVQWSAWIFFVSFTYLHTYNGAKGDIRTTYNVQHTTYDVRRTTYNIRNVKFLGVEFRMSTFS